MVTSGQMEATVESNIKAVINVVIAGGRWRSATTAGGMLILSLCLN